jgi:hypothetical protein
VGSQGTGSEHTRHPSWNPRIAPVLEANRVNHSEQFQLFLYEIKLIMIMIKVVGERIRIESFNVQSTKETFVFLVNKRVASPFRIQGLIHPGDGSIVGVAQDVHGYDGVDCPDLFTQVWG